MDNAPVDLDDGTICRPTSGMGDLSGGRGASSGTAHGAAGARSNSRHEDGGVRIVGPWPGSSFTPPVVAVAVIPKEQLRSWLQSQARASDLTAATSL